MIDLSIRSGTRVWLWTLAGTLICIVATLAVDFTFSTFKPDEIPRAIIMDTLLPTLLAGPLLFFLLSKNRALAIAHEEMAMMASTDALTGILNRGAFTMLVESYLAKTRLTVSDTCGSLLVIDADNFKAINDRFGHSTGDEALRLIALDIQKVLRPADLVGRIGGEEFAVFLPSTSSAQALNVAERIRTTIGARPFPNADEKMLSVSVGGVNFNNEDKYEPLFQFADTCLYKAKNNGRNQVSMSDYRSASASSC